jgi:hypothetical protein
MQNLIFILIVCAVALNGILVGASLDQSIKQLPARRQTSAVIYSAYSRASDLGNGIAWYVVIGIGSLLITVVTAIAAGSPENSPSYVTWIDVAVILSILHTLTTTQAAPIMFSQRRYENDEGKLAQVFNRFERWQTLRAVLQVLTFAALLSALIGYG